MAAERKVVVPNQPVRFSSGTTLETALGAARATSWDGTTPPGERDLDPRFERALADVGLVERETIHLELEPQTRHRAATRGVGARSDRVVIEPAPADDGPQVVLYVDESGGVSWHFPDGHFLAPSAGNANKRGTLRRSAAASFTIDTRTTAALRSLQGRTQPRTRGIITKLGRKIFKIFVIPIGSKLLAKPIAEIVGKVERSRRRQLVRGVTPDNYSQPVKTPFADWARLAEGRSLLIVHGIFSSTEGMLSRLPPGVMEELHKRYDGRVIAFDHHTTSVSPEENARLFLETVRAKAGPRPIELDILCHSRGGIVSRLIAERGRELVPAAPCAVKKVFFVAVPNQGSPLADPEHIVDMIDVFTNFVTSLPDGPVAYSIEVVLAVVKLLAATAERHLPGLAAMGTSGVIPELNRVGAKPQAVYAAAAANYEPDPTRDSGFFTGRFADDIVDRVFTRDDRPIDNDLVVPQLGVFSANGHPSFPIANPLVFEAADRVQHTTFFAERRTHEALLAFLGTTTARLREAPVAMSDLLVESEDAELIFDDPFSLNRGVSPRGRRKSLTELTAPYAPSGTHPSSRRFATRGVRASSVPSGKVESARKAKAPRASTAAEETTVTREPWIQFHERVDVGKMNPLVVGLNDVVAAAGAEAFDVAFASGETEVPLIVSLTSSGFDVKPRPDLKLTVRRDHEPTSEHVTFKLTARDLGPTPVLREIRAEIRSGNSPLGAVTHQTYVIPKGFKGSKPSAYGVRTQPFVRDGRRQDCDLVIKVEGVDEEGKPPYRIRLDCTVPGQEYDGKFGGQLSLKSGKQTVEEYIRQQFADAFVSYPKGNLSAVSFDRAMRSWRTRFGGRMTSLGRRLWNWLPAPLRAEYFRLRDDGVDVRSIRISSQEMVIPWELLIPNRTTRQPKELPPLGAAHVLGRWRPGLRIVPSPQQMRIDHACVVNPQYAGSESLLWSLQEVQALRKLIPSIEVVRPVDYTTLKQRVLTRRDLHLVHFSGHGDYAKKNVDLSDLKLEGGDSLAAIDFQGVKLLSEGQAIIYLNACNVGNPGTVVGRMGGFAAICIESGCSGVIAPYWPVNDETAVQFSAGFYEKLTNGRSIGEALMELRAANPEDPTFLAYSYFGDPWTSAAFTETAPPRARATKSRPHRPV